MADEQKLTDAEKVKLLAFYKENNELWVTQGITRSQKAKKKEELVEEFEGKFSIEILEKAFHSLKASFLREYKKYEKDGKVPNKPWKFYDNMLFLKEEPKNPRVSFTTEERETLITFYHTNPPLWNHGLLEYRDRDIRRALLLKLCDELDGKFTEEDIKKDWNSLLTRYRKERQAEKTSRSSGAGVDDVFNSSWEHFEHMTFLETTPETDPVMSTLGKSAETTPPAPKKSKPSQESEARAALYIALAKSFEKPSSPPPSSIELKKDGNNLTERANLFGKTVADNLLQCDPKDWTLIKKKIFDLFFDYEQGNLTSRNNTVTPFNSFNYAQSNATAYQNLGYTGQTPTQPQNNQSSSGFQDFSGFNHQMQPVHRNNPQVQSPQTPYQDPYSPFSPTNSNNSA